jgi:hypothetical protein
MLPYKGDRLQGSSTGTRLAKLAFLLLMSRSACWLFIHPPGYVFRYDRLRHLRVTNAR